MDNVNRGATNEVEDRRARRVSRAVTARRRLDRAPSPSRRGAERTGGRVWVNGVEVGGTDPRHATLVPTGG
jgi:hypothetical protein